MRSRRRRCRCEKERDSESRERARRVTGTNWYCSPSTAHRAPFTRALFCRAGRTQRPSFLSFFLFACVRVIRQATATATCLSSPLHRLPPARRLRPMAANNLMTSYVQSYPTDTIQLTSFTQQLGDSLGKGAFGQVYRMLDLLPRFSLFLTHVVVCWDRRTQLGHWRNCRC